MSNDKSIQIPKRSQTNPTVQVLTEDENVGVKIVPALTFSVCSWGGPDLDRIAWYTFLPSYSQTRPPSPWTRMPALHVTVRQR